MTKRMEQENAPETEDAQVSQGPAEFSLDRVEEPVKIGGEDYVLQEMDGRDRDAHLTFVTGRMVTDRSGNQSVRDFADLQTDLIARCLRKVESNGQLRQVKSETINKWPCRVVEGLNEMCKVLNNIGLEEKEEEEEGED